MSGQKRMCRVSIYSTDTFQNTSLLVSNLSVSTSIKKIKANLAALGLKKTISVGCIKKLCIGVISGRKTNADMNDCRLCGATEQSHFMY